MALIVTNRLTVSLFLLIVTGSHKYTRAGPSVLSSSSPTYTAAQKEQNYYYLLQLTLQLVHILLGENYGIPL